MEILPYYIANLNIEYTYKERTERYLEFPNLSFVDTLDNMDWKGASGAAVQRQTQLNLGGVSEENWIRVQEQNEQPISVIVGNPPYNANQQNENDNNKNREYPEIDRRIRETYIKESTAQKTKQYDMYKRFIRWASDRLEDDGIIGFVSNSAFLDARQDDGFRKVVAEEFNELWVVDLKGNARTSGERRRQEGGNVFDDKIRVGVAVYFLVRRKGAHGFKVFYNAVDDYAKAFDKVAYVKNKAIDALEFAEITPDAKANWLDQSDSDFEELIPLANRETKMAKSVSDEQAVFGLYSLGIATNRDEWTFDLDEDLVADKVSLFCRVYRDEMRRYAVETPDTVSINDWVDRSIKWTSELEQHLVKGDAIEFTTANIVPALYRPYVAKHCYFAPMVTHRRYQQPLIFPHEFTVQNRVISYSGVGSSKAFSVLATDKVYSLDLLEKTQCLPLYRYKPDGERVSNITKWGLRQFRQHYGDDGISADDIFAYVYAMLHDPAYRSRYEIDLRREFPRVYFQADSAWWTQKGRELLDLHLGFETAEPWPLERQDKDGVEPKRAILRSDKERGIITLDERTSLTGIPPEAWEYRLGSRSALEWVLDQYKERQPKDPTIRERFNTYRFADHKDRVIDLLGRVCAVSVFTTTIVDELSLRSAIEHD